MTRSQTLKKRMLTDPKVRKVYDELGLEYEVAAALIRARARAGMTQADVARKMKTTQSVVARMESGRSLPSMSSIHRYAQSVGARAVLTLEFTRRRRSVA